MCTTKFLHKRSELDWFERQLGQCQSPYSIIVILSSDTSKPSVHKKCMFECGVRLSFLRLSSSLIFCCTLNYYVI